MDGLSKSTVFAVTFIKGDGIHEMHLFGSLSSIFQKYSSEDIGVTLKTLQNAALKPGASKLTSCCIISKLYLFRKKHAEK